MLAELKEHGLHHLEQRGLRKRVNGTAAFKHETSSKRRGIIAFLAL